MKFSSAIHPGDVIALGDIHGRFDLLSQFLDWVSNSDARVVLLGDLIDRGPEDVQVLHTVKRMLDHPEAFGLRSVDVLLGNHEQMMLDACEGRMQDISLWVQNGANIKAADQIFEHHDWVSKLPTYKVIEDTLFVHAGIFPGDPMENQEKEDLIWIRNPFLSQGGDLSKVFPDGSVKRVVHGHSVLSPGNPTVCADRVGIDSGAFFTGVLTAFNSTQNTFHQLTEAIEVKPL